MKYKTFILLRNGAGLGVLLLATFAAFEGCRKASTTADPVTTAVENRTRSQMNRSVTTESKPGKSAVPKSNRIPSQPLNSTGATVALDGRDQEIIRLQKEPTTNGKSNGSSTKWMAIGDGFRAEFRADSGSNVWNRVKIDVDSDKKADERWDFKADGSIKRRVSPDDNEDYSVEYRLKPGSGKWIRSK